ncbi:hypothetical protein NLI96_g8396 [Meripilus lineatus]|uniref:Zn(2)-C6 fungal-type domain-containing protein n=1 Tax=Meripilus lineatus TaxID=2056292 RepID=A0AAD5YGB4_9APHY|nr:hypothetical protein NLI96_g8396 [Physisporinus lineatus]
MSSLATTAENTTNASASGSGTVTGSSRDTSSSSSGKTTIGMGKDPNLNVPASNGGGKVKQTRVRQRLSCVECTKRRQKCDRKVPCGLCVSRGIPNLCRWEPFVVRPTPQRPPVISPEPSAQVAAAAAASAEATIQTLTARVAALEKALAAKQVVEETNIGIGVDASGVSSGSGSPSNGLNGVNGNGGYMHGEGQRVEMCSEQTKKYLYPYPHLPVLLPPGLPLSAPCDSGHISRPPTDPTADGPRALIDFNVQVAAVALAQLSLAPRTEYIGAGTVLCAIHKLGDPESYKYPIPNSTSMTGHVSSTTTAGSGSGSGSGASPASATTTSTNGVHQDHPARSPIRELVSHLPPREEMDNLLSSFFATRNAEYGVSETWFRCAVAKMWHHLDLRCICPTPDEYHLLNGQTGVSVSASAGGCPACQEEINPHWLALLFSILSLSPRTGKTNGGLYFSQACKARRLVDDILLASVYSTSEFAVHGGVLSCLAAVFLGAYLADRGRVSEAWKIVGNALRTAQALGLHRDPRWRRWEAMGKLECGLRVLTWWMLASFDRLYSFILGRPAMAVRGAFEMMPGRPPATHGDGSPNPNALFQREFIQLSELICDAASKLLSFENPSYAAVVDMDRRFQEYEAHIPPQLQWRAYIGKGMSPDSSSGSPSEGHLPIQERFVCYHRVILAAWYLDSLMNIHRPYLMHPPPILPVPGSSATSRSLNPSRERCIQLAMELTRTLCRFHSECTERLGSERTAPSMFSYFLFDGAVALAGALSQVPPHPQASECLDLMDHAMRALEDMANAAEGAEDGEGETAKRGIKVLAALRKAGGWDMDEGEKGELVSMIELQRQQHQQQQRVAGGREGWGGLASTTTNGYGHGGHGGHGNALPHPHPHQHSHSHPTTGYMGAIPFLNSPDQGYFHFPSSNSSSDISSSSSTPLPATSTTLSTASSSFSSPPSSTPMFLDDDFGPLPTLGPQKYYSSATPSHNAPTRTVQNMLPYEVLQGVQPSSNGRISEFDLDWARLAGMENWYSGVTIFDGSV